MQQQLAKHAPQTLVLALTASLFAAASATAQTTQRISLGVDEDNNGSFDQAVLWSEHADLTPDGKYVVFASAAWNLLGRDHDPQSPLFGQQIDRGFVDVFRRDLATGDIERVSVDSMSVANNENSGFPSISDDGSRIAFAAKGNQMENTYFQNTGQQSVGDGGWDVFVRDVGAFTKETRLISFGFDSFDADGVGLGAQRSANAETRLPQISGDGQHIVYASKATNLSPTDTDSEWDIYVYDWAATQPVNSTNTLVSVSGSGVKGNAWSMFPSISDDGRFIVFDSKSTNLDTGPADSNNHWDIFLHDRDTDNNGIFDEPGAISTTLISKAYSANAAGDGPSRFAMISGDGSTIGFVSWASDLVPNDTNGEPDVFVVDRTTGAITRVSVNTDGSEGDGPSGFSSARVAISNNDMRIAFARLASSLELNRKNP